MRCIYYTYVYMYVYGAVVRGMLLGDVTEMFSHNRRVVFRELFNMSMLVFERNIRIINNTFDKTYYCFLGAFCLLPIILLLSQLLTKHRTYNTATANV